MVFTACAHAQPSPKMEYLKIESQVKLAIPEPSDASLSEDGSQIFIVSDNGILFATDLAGKVTKRFADEGYDYEGVFQRGSKIYVAEERTRKVHEYDMASGKRMGTHTIPFGGGRNKGYESLTFSKAKNCFIIITEKSPTVLLELTDDFGVRNEVELTGFSDISSATYYKEKMWILSDEDMTITRIDANTYATEQAWKLPVMNPEGFYFSANGKELHVLSDDLGVDYKFDATNLLAY